MNQLHPLVSVVVVSLMAVLAGAGGPTAIARWALLKEDLLRKLLPLPNGIPRKDVYRRVLALKGNQGNLYQAAVDDIDAQIETDFADVESRRHVTVEKGHGRQERRIAIQLPAPKSLPGFGRWAGLRTIGIVVLLCQRDGKETSDMRYFISSLAMGVRRFARAVRGHWGIENSCHWSLDFTYREDESRIRDECLRENMAWLNRFTLSLLQQHSSKDSIVMKRRGCGWSDDFLTEVLTGEAS